MGNLIVELCVSAVVGIGTGLFVDGIPTLATKLVRLAASRLPKAYSNHFAEDWMASLHDRQTRASQIAWAIGCCAASLQIEFPGQTIFYERYEAFVFLRLSIRIRCMTTLLSVATDGWFQYFAISNFSYQCDKTIKDFAAYNRLSRRNYIRKYDADFHEEVMKRVEQTAVKVNSRIVTLKNMALEQISEWDKRKKSHP